jgi:murein DD-endopeptidase MepM/ murein hydrolase activator NlpD
MRACVLVAATACVWSARPAPVTIDGRDWLIYELHLTTSGRQPQRLARIDVLADRGAEVLRSFEGDDLAQRSASNADGGTVIYLEVPVSREHPPRSIRHRVNGLVGDKTRLDSRAPVVIGAPLRGGPWAAVYAWEWPRGHRRVYYATDGRARIPGRLAIDWVRRDAQGLSAHGDADLVGNSLGYGADVLAVADARVSLVRDGIAESARVSDNPEHPLDEAAGNYVSLDLGNGRFAIYEHLVPGSIRVARGERVRRGQVIASLGFTGDSTEPHLHFHVADNPAPLLGEGLPFELERFCLHVGADTQSRERERPSPNAVISFD